MEALEALGINLGFLIAYTIGFLIMLVVLNRWVYKPILSVLEKRRVTIAQGIEDARVAGEARANAEKEADKILAQAQARAGELVREATERAEAVGKDILADAEAKAVKIQESAKAEAENEKERMLTEVRPQIVTLAMAAAQKLIGDALDEQRQRSLLNEFFAGIKSGKVVMLEGTAAAGESAVVTSALPLTKDEQDAVKKDLLAKVGSQTVVFRVDPNILGGLVIKVGDRVLDGSVAGQLEGMRERLS